SAGAETACRVVHDGLPAGRSRLCEASGVGARVALGAVPVAETLSRGAEMLGVDASALALSGGEDYELLATLPEGAVEAAREDLRSGFGVDLSEIGEIVAGAGVLGGDAGGRGSGVLAVDADGRTAPLEPSGWDHFAQG